MNWVKLLVAVSSTNFVKIYRSYDWDQRCALYKHSTVIINLTLVARVTLTHLITALVMGPIEMLYRKVVFTPSKRRVVTVLQSFDFQQPA